MSTAATSQHQLDLEEKLLDAQRRFDRAVEQIVQLDLQIQDLENLYKRSISCKKNASRYNLRLKLSVVTGIKMMYHHYCSLKAEEINHMRVQLFHNDMGSSQREQSERR